MIVKKFPIIDVPRVIHVENKTGSFLHSDQPINSQHLVWKSSKTPEMEKSGKT